MIDLIAAALVIVGATGSLLVSYFGISRGTRPGVRPLLCVTALCMLAGGAWQYWSTAYHAKHLESAVTGGDSFAFIEPFLDASGNSSFGVRHSGSAYPVYDLTVRATDVKKRIALLKISSESAGLGAFFAGSTTVPLGTLPISSELVNVIRFDPIQSPDWEFEFNKRNGAYRQSTRIRRVGQNWATAMRVHTLDEQDTTLLQAVSSDYPLDDAEDWIRAAASHPRLVAR